jgi:hypothetical protein
MDVEAEEEEEKDEEDVATAATSEGVVAEGDAPEHGFDDDAGEVDETPPQSAR